MTTLAEIISTENATYIQQTGEDDVVLYRTLDGRPQKLGLARVGCGLRGVLETWQPRDDWFKMDEWADCLFIPVGHPLWPVEVVQ